MDFTIIWSEIRVARERSRARARLGTAARCHRANGAAAISDIEGKATRVGASERGQRTSFKSLLILISSGDIQQVCGNHR